MIRLSALLGISLVSIATPALADPKIIRGSKDGVSYEGTAELQKDGYIRYRGVYLSTGERFRFTLSPRGRIRGHVDGWPVSHSVGKLMYERAAARLTGPSQLAGAIR